MRDYSLQHCQELLDKLLEYAETAEQDEFLRIYAVEARLRTTMEIMEESPGSVPRNALDIMFRTIHKIIGIPIDEDPYGVWRDGKFIELDADEARLVCYQYRQQNELDDQIHCKDCDYVNDDPCCTHPRWRQGQSGVVVYPSVEPDGYCAWAERSENCG